LNNQLEISTMVKSGANGNQLRIESKFKMETDSKDKVRDSGETQRLRQSDGTSSDVEGDAVEEE
jgi:hypothetical protein